jgi:subtilisin family serine protease
LGFPGQGGDGTTGWYRDGTSSVAKKVNEATVNGTLFTVAAGNQGLSHWSGTYMKNTTAMGEPLNGDMETIVEGSGKYQSVMIFNQTAPAGDPMQACLPINAQPTNNPFVMSWNAWDETATEDYDFVLYSADMIELIEESGSFIPQNPLNRAPLEFFNHALSGDLCLVVFEFSSTKDNFLHIDIDNNSFRDLSYIVKPGSIDTPADASGALTVGAVNFNNSPTTYSDDFLEPFSSQGPTDDARAKPEICGPDGTSSSQYGGKFTGTSSATPHVAGAAALLLE